MICGKNIYCGYQLRIHSLDLIATFRWFVNCGDFVLIYSLILIYLNPGHNLNKIRWNKLKLSLEELSLVEISLDWLYSQSCICLQTWWGLVVTWMGLTMITDRPSSPTLSTNALASLEPSAVPLPSSKSQQECWVLLCSRATCQQASRATKALNTNRTPPTGPCQVNVTLCVEILKKTRTAFTTRLAIWHNTLTEYCEKIVLLILFFTTRSLLHQQKKK